MRGADVSNADVSQQIHGEIEVIGVLGLDDVENDGEFGRQTLDRLLQFCQLRTRRTFLYRHTEVYIITYRELAPEPWR